MTTPQILSQAQAEYVARAVMSAVNHNARITIHLAHEESKAGVRITEESGVVIVGYELMGLAHLAETYANPDAFCDAYNILHRRKPPQFPPLTLGDFAQGKSGVLAITPSEKETVK